MSKTTFFKRIALTAVAALGFGMLSVAPSQSAVTAHTLTIDNAADALTLEGGTADSATATLTHNWVALGSAQDSVVIRAIVTSSNAANIGKLMLSVTDSYSSTANDATEANSPRYTFGGTSWSSGRNAVTTFKTTVYGAAARDSITIVPGGASTYGTADRSYGSVIQLKAYQIKAAGTYTVSVYTQTSNAGAALVSATPSATWTITATAPSKSAAADSTLLVRTGVTAGSTGTANTDSNTLSAATSTATTLTPAYTVEVLQKNGTSTNTAQESYTVTVSGEAFITQGHTCAATTTATYTTRPVGAGGSKTLTGCTPTAGTASKVHVWSTGTAGTATLTFTTVSGLALGTKTFTFFGDAAAIAVTTTTSKVIRSGTATAQSAIASVTVTDALGNKVTGEAPEIVSSDVTQITSGSCADVSTANATTADGVYSCSVTPVATSSSGKAVTLTIRIQDPAVTTVSYLSTTYAVTMGGAAVTYVLTTDKATYEAGEAMVVTATAKDASGNTPYDGQAGPTIRGNKALGGTAAATTITMNLYYDGVSTSQTRSTAVRTMSTAQTLFAPAASGKFTISGLDGQTTPATVSVTATVGDDAATTAANAASDAAAEAIDAANAATDAANLAAEAADAATVAAEEARDAADAATAAVEALATEVATLMAALKAQITTLANTVAKIAKKVKA
jgi:hypothetical protein